MTTLQWQEDDPIWLTIDAFFHQHGSNVLAAHQIDSFHDFVEVQIPAIMNRKAPLVVFKDIRDDPLVKRMKCEFRISDPEFGQPYIMDPDMDELTTPFRALYPYEARMRNVSYQFPITAKLSYTVWTFGDSDAPLSEHRHESRQFLTHMLSMVHSKYCTLWGVDKTPEVMEPLGECYLDDGGYFIINGNEKVVIPQEKMCDNRVYLFDQKNNPKFSHVAEIRSMDPLQLIVNIMQIRVHSQESRSRIVRWSRQRRQTVIGSKKTGIKTLGGQMLVKVSHVKKDIPLFVLLRAMGEESHTDADLLALLIGAWTGHDRYDEYLDLLQPSIDEMQDFPDRTSCILYILDKFTVKLNKENPVAYVQEFFEKKVFPQYGVNRAMKLQYMGYCTRQLMDTMLGYRRYSDRDHYGNKRVELTGNLFTQLFVQVYDRFMKDLKMSIHKEMTPLPVDQPPQLHKIIKHSLIEKSFKYALSTGNWNMKRNMAQNEKRKGVAQVLSRMTYVSTLSHLRRINTPMENKSGKLVRPRQLHCSHMGFICPAETPEGQPVGLVKNMSLFNAISLDGLPVIKHLLREWVTLWDEAPAVYTPASVLVFLNGMLIGAVPSVAEAVALRTTLRTARRAGDLAYDVSVVLHLDRHELLVYTDAGRMLRPLFVLDAQERLPWETGTLPEWTWKTMLLHGWIEYVDPEETELIMVETSVQALLASRQVKEQHGFIRPAFTHVEIHPMGMLGILAAMIPFSDHNQSPRNTYQSAMGKQCISVYMTNIHQRMDTVSNVLFHPERPLVSTRIAPYVHTNEMPYGQNVILAFGIWTSYNEEDAIIMNQSAVERGLFHAVSFKTYKAEERKHHVSIAEEKFCRPDQMECKGKRFGCYDKLDERGMVKEGAYVTANDVIIGKVTPQGTRAKKVTYRDSSVTIKPSDVGTVDKVFLSTNQDAYRIAKIRIRADREPVLGDKFAARYGQKGTVGMLYRQEDMPFLSDGTPIDMMINPHSIPSRMTIGMLLEIFIGKVSSQTGTFYDATPFESDVMADIPKYEALLKSFGIQCKGWERLYNGVTGEWMDARIFVGPCHYQRLKHMVVDKLHSRARGPVAPLTRQPCEGRSRSGGLRLGEMERDVLLAHGASHFLQERLFTCSDAFYVYVCDLCGLMAPIHEGPLPRPELDMTQCCKPCKNYTKFSKVALPFASKCLFQELSTMGIVPRIEAD